MGGPDRPVLIGGSATVTQPAPLQRLLPPNQAPPPESVPDFPVWFRSVVHAARDDGTSVRESSLAAGFPSGTFKGLLRREAYPRTKERLEKICAYFDVSAEWQTTWNVEIRRRDSVRARKEERWIEKICAQCNKSFEFRSRPPESKQRREGVYCGRTCQSRAAMNRLVPKTELGRFLFDQLRESRQTKAAYARRIGVSWTCLSWLLNDALPTQKNLERLEAFFGDAMPETATETERRQKMVREPLLIEKAKRLANTPEALRKRGLKLRGRKKSPQEIERQLASSRASGGLERALAALAEYRDSEKGKAERALFTRLRATPAPDESTLAGWAIDDGKRLELAALVVRAYWTEYMAKKGLLAGSTADQQHQQICALRNRTSAERWKDIAQDFSFANDESCRVAHNIWHKGSTAPPCGRRREP